MWPTPGFAPTGAEVNPGAPNGTTWERGVGYEEVAYEGARSVRRSVRRRSSGHSGLTDIREAS